MKDNRKLLVIGLDSAPPELVFGKFLNDLPNLKKFVENGIYGNLRTTIPPITIPAWLVMMTGKNPGKLGIYGFRHRKDNSYNDIWIAHSGTIESDKAWDILGRNGKKVCLVSFPPSYPPTLVNGHMVSCFLTPDANSEYTYPPELKRELEDNVGKYIPDVEFRTDKKDELLKGLYEMTERRFDMIDYLIKNKEWDFFMFVDIGVDRIQHGFWRYFDEEHHLYTPNSPYRDAIKDYYLYIDRRLGDILSDIDDDTIVMVVSDHGAKRMKGAVCINEWLIKEGYLRLNETPNEPISPGKADIDWENTKAWGWGGYYARLFLNVKGREPKGTIEPGEYENMRNELIEKIENIADIHGNKMDTYVFRPEDLFGTCNGDYPDLMVCFDDLYWRSAGTIGHESMYLLKNDTGPDDCVHDWDGIFILYDPKRKHGKRIDGMRIEDVAPTILRIMGQKIPSELDGSPLGMDI